MTTRRDLMKMLGLAPAVPGVAVEQLKSLVATSAVSSSLAQTVGFVSPGMQPSGEAPGLKTLGQVLFKELLDARRKLEIERNARHNLTAWGLDSDIAALKSTSSSYKRRKQFERFFAEEEALTETSRAMWG